LAALPTARQAGPVTAELPEWWGDIAKAKQEGKKIVTASQGTVGLNLNDLLIPTLEALKDRHDVSVIATTIIVEVANVPGLVIPANARATKFLPYDLLLPEVCPFVSKPLRTTHPSRSTSSSTTAATALQSKVSPSAYPWCLPVRAKTINPQTPF
jgi:hypothetical protein